MQVYADFEIRLSRDEGHSYLVQIRIRRFDYTISEPPACSFSYDQPLHDALLVKTISPDDYGRCLGEALLRDTLLDELDKAIAGAEALNKPVRLTIQPDRSAHELQSLWWETLRHPRTDLPIACNSHIVFSRFLTSASGRTVRLPLHGQARAVIAVAAPNDAETKWNLRSIDSKQEFDTARSGLSNLSYTCIGGEYGHATREALLSALLDGADVLYLVAHGGLLAPEKFPEIKLPGPHPVKIPCLYLEGSDGRTLPVDAHDLVADLAQLPMLPRLAVVVSCRSAEPASATSLAWLLGEAGVPAVLAMQGDFQMATAKIFLPALLAGLQRNEPIDMAVRDGRAAAKSAGSVDWWMPALFSRVSDGRIWQVDEQRGRRELEYWLHAVQPRLNTAELTRLTQALLACPSTSRLPLADLPNLEALCAELHYWDAQQTAALDALNAVLHDLQLLPPIPWAKVVELQLLLAAVSLTQNDLDFLYGRSRPSADWIQPVGRDVANTLTQIVYQLANALPDYKKCHALIEFVRRLYAELRQQVAPVADKLREWDVTTCAQLGLAPPQSEPASVDSPPVLSIQLTLAPGVIEPDLSHPVTVPVIFNAWLITDTTQQLAHCEELSLAQAEVRFAEIEKVAVTSARRSSDVLPIEFVLPLELLLYPFEAWTIKRTRLGLPTPVAYLHPVVVRSFERLNPAYIEDIRRDWESRWRRRRAIELKRLVDRTTLGDALVLIDQGGRSIKGIIAALTNAKRVLLLQTAQLDDSDLFLVLGSAIEQGYPIALIVRSPCADPSRTAARLCMALAEAASFDELPSLVMSQRQAAGETDDEQHYGNHLTLLWDNPERIPPLMFYA